MTDSPRGLSPERRFGVASAGGTFHGLHTGHRAYMEVALQLAQLTHIFLTDDSYAQMRKRYDVDSAERRREEIERFAESTPDRGEYRIHVVKAPDEVNEFCRREPLDLVLATPEHVRRFLILNRARLAAGLPEFFILVKPRTRVGEDEVSASAIELPPT